MKKISLFLFTTVLVINVACAQSDWVTYKIDDKLSVKMPTEPQRQDRDDMMAFDKDSSVYIASVTDLGTDTGKIAKVISGPDFANKLKAAMLGKMPGFTLGDINRNTWKRYPCFLLEGNNKSAHLKLHCYMIIISNKLYFLATVLAESKGNQSNDDFFASLTLN